MLFLPVELQFQLGEPVALKLLSGVTGPLDNLGDADQVPLGLGLVGNVSTGLDLGVRFCFDNLLGPQPPGVDNTDLRSLAAAAAPSVRLSSKFGTLTGSRAAELPGQSAACYVLLMSLFSRDTRPEVVGVLLDGYRRMTPAEKLARVADLSAASRQMAAARIRQQHPGSG